MYRLRITSHFLFCVPLKNISPETWLRRHFFRASRRMFLCERASPKNNHCARDFIIPTNSSTLEELKKTIRNAWPTNCKPYRGMILQASQGASKPIFFAEALSPFPLTMDVLKAGSPTLYLISSQWPTKEAPAGVLGIVVLQHASFF